MLLATVVVRLVACLENAFDADGCLTASAGPLARQWYCDVVALCQKHDCVLGPDGFWCIFRIMSFSGLTQLA